MRKFPISFSSLYMTNRQVVFQSHI